MGVLRCVQLRDDDDEDAACDIAEALSMSMLWMRVIVCDVDCNVLTCVLKVYCAMICTECYVHIHYPYSHHYM